MAHDLSAPLTTEEFAGLTEANKGITQGPVGHEQVERLVELGYVIRRLGTLSLTVAGNLRLATGQ